MEGNGRESKDEITSKRSTKYTREDSEVVVETKYVPDGGWGWMIVFGCAFLRMVIGTYVLITLCFSITADRELMLATSLPV